MNFEEKITEETKNIQIETKDIADHEWGTPFPGYEYYKKLIIKINDELLHVVLSFTESLGNDFCEEINAMWGDDRNPDYIIDLTGFWLEFPKDWDNDIGIVDEIKDIAIKYYLIAKYDTPSYIRKGFNIYEFLGVDKK